MSKVNKWQYEDPYQMRRAKIINMLFSEIIFLKRNLNNTDCLADQNTIINALNKLEYILGVIESKAQGLSDEDFDKFVLLVYRIFRTIVSELDK